MQIFYCVRAYAPILKKQFHLLIIQILACPYACKKIGGYSATPKNDSLRVYKDTLKEILEHLENAKTDKIKYINTFLNLVKKQEIKSLDEFLKTQFPLSPLIELSPTQSIRDVKKHLIKLLKNTSYLFINSPDDFKRYLYPFALENGQRVRKQGPLAAILKEGGTLIVNWSNFTDTQLASYKSIIDKEPTLLGESLHHVKVIGLKGPKMETCTAFSSRCQPCTLNSDALKTTTDKKTENKSKNEIIELDLFERPDWREHLLGSINIEGDKLTLKESPIMEAFTKNKTLLINNPPKDDQFSLMLEQIEDEGRILINGKMVDVSSLQIKTAIKKNISEAKNVNVKIVEEKELPKSLFFIGLHNFHELLEQLIIENKKAKTEKGLLNQFNQFYITESIPENFWQRLINYINHHYPEKHFEFFLAPGVEIQTILENKKQALGKSGNIHLSNDTDYLVSKLQEDMKESPIVIDVTPNMGFHDLIAKIQIQPDAKDKNKVIFDLEEKAMFIELLKGKNIILNGEISNSLYQQLLPLLSSPPQFYHNGKLTEVTSKLILAMPFTAKNNLNLSKCTEHLSHNYIGEFKLSDQKYVKKINQFYEMANLLPHRGLGYPERPVITYHHLKRLVESLKNPKLHLRNPIKGLFLYDYPVYSSDYAYLNVIAKYLFNPYDATSIRKNKLIRLVNKFNITRENFNLYAWKILNCFSGKDINRILAHDFSKTIALNNQPIQLTEKALTLLWAKVQRIILKPMPAATRVSHIEKRSLQLQKLIDDKETPFIMIKGSAGVGKTFTVSQLKNVSLHEGEKNIKAWLEDSSNNPKILLLDEANLAIPGTWDFLKGLSRDNKNIYYQGKHYSLSPLHKVIATGNPENFPGRHYHTFFQRYFETLHFRSPEDDYLKHIMENILGEKYKSSSIPLLDAYKLIQAHNPTYVYSTRDLENLTRRYLICAEDKSISNAILKACISEFAGTIPTLDKRNHFITELESKFSNKAADDKSDDVIAISPTQFIPREKSYLVEGIEQDLKIRSVAMSNKTYQFYKQGILIDGEAGLGKSTLYKLLLEKNGFTKDSLDTQRKYYEITVGDHSAYQILKKAFHEGAAVILDELNLDSNLETLLNQLLTGKDMDGKPADKPGFLVLASQNPSYEKGRKSVSQALRNRMHVMYMNPYSEEALLSIAKKFNVPMPNDFVTSFISAKEKYPHDINMRTFYTAISVVLNQARIDEKLFLDSKSAFFKSVEATDTASTAYQPPMGTEAEKKSAPPSISFNIKSK